MQAPKISVIIPVFNRERLIGRAIDSVLAQSYVDYEIIVVDDGSTDGTLRELARFGDRVAVVSQPNRGPYAARNVGLGKARGDYVAFLDSDDTWYPDRLEKQIKLMEADPELGLVYGNGNLVDESNRRKRTFFEHGNAPKRGLVFADLLECNFIPQSSVLIRRRCFDETGAFWELPLSADYHKWLQVALRYPVDYVEDIVFNYHLHGDQIVRDRVSQYRNNLKVTEYFLKSVRDPSLLRSVRRRALEVRVELGLVCCRDGARYLCAALGNAVDGISPIGRVAIFLSTVKRSLRNVVRKG